MSHEQPVRMRPAPTLALRTATLRKSSRTSRNALIGSSSARRISYNRSILGWPQCISLLQNFSHRLGAGVVLDGWSSSQVTAIVVSNITDCRDFEGSRKSVWACMWLPLRLLRRQRDEFEDSSLREVLWPREEAGSCSSQTPACNERDAALMSLA